MPLPAPTLPDQTPRRDCQPIGIFGDDTSLTAFGIATALTLGLFWPEIARGFCHLLVIASGAPAP